MSNCITLFRPGPRRILTTARYFQYNRNNCTIKLPPCSIQFGLFACSIYVGRTYIWPVANFDELGTNRFSANRQCSREKSEFMQFLECLEILCIRHCSCSLKWPANTNTRCSPAAPRQTLYIENSYQNAKFNSAEPRSSDSTS